MKVCSTMMKSEATSKLLDGVRPHALAMHRSAEMMQKKNKDADLEKHLERVFTPLKTLTATFKTDESKINKEQRAAEEIAAKMRADAEKIIEVKQDAAAPAVAFGAASKEKYEAKLADLRVSLLLSFW